MPTLDRSLLAWSDDSDTEDVAAATVDDDRLLLATSGGCGGGAGASCYDRACAAAVDDVLVPADGGDGESPASGARKAVAAAGLVAVGCLCAYLAWRYYCGGGAGAGKLHASA